MAPDVDGTLLGFVIVLAPGADYSSPNYRYFEQRYRNHRYVDRIAVTDSARGRGIGRELYDAVFAHTRDAGAPMVTCEVNVEPPNPTSSAFHRTLGFREVGRQDTYDGTVTGRAPGPRHPVARRAAAAAGGLRYRGRRPDLRRSRVGPDSARSLRRADRRWWGRR